MGPGAGLGQGLQAVQPPDQRPLRDDSGKARLQERDPAPALPDPGRWLLRWQDKDGRKRPYFIYRRDGQPVGFAALAETWLGPNGEELDTVAIVTAPASPDLASLHHRVPVTIAPVAFERWLDCRSDDAEAVMDLLIGPDEGEFAWHEVSTRVNHVAQDDPQLLLPITAEQRAAEEAPPKKVATRKAAASSRDDGQGSLF